MRPNLIAFLLIGIYFILERVLRKGEVAKSIKRGRYGRGSMLFIGVAFALSFLILASGLLFNLTMGQLDNKLFVGWIGVVLMIVGLIIRYSAARTLGKYYSRTLLLTENQEVVKNGLYKLIRHPGYFGVFLMWIGAGLSSSNWIITALILLTMFIGYSYRIKKEESMLLMVFGNKYREYMKKTYKLIPFIY